MPEHHDVLIVEDDAAIRDVFNEVLRGAGHGVSLARNGAEAMNLLRDGHAPCVIVADLLMPVLDGWGLAAELVKVSRTASIPLVILSAQPSSGPQDIPSGARARLTKPISIAALLEIVEQHCAASDRTGAGRPMADRKRS